MKKETQLLCTFTTVDDLENTVKDIEENCELIFNKIYVLENVDNPDQLVLTYNIKKPTRRVLKSPPSTISVHRKKQTNTIYTINAINKLIEHELGYLDKSYRIDWEELENTVLVTAYNELKIVNTKLLNIIDTTP